MSTFLIALIILLITSLVASMVVLSLTIANDDISKKEIRIMILIICLVTISGTLFGIGIEDEEERIYVSKFEVQKQTIEMSLQNDELSGYERLQLVQKATELNGEFAERKARYNLWHHIHFDYNIYDDVELIALSKGYK